MPIADHDDWEMPGENDALWRYMDVPKFLNLLTTKKLWLGSAQQLAMEDSHELTFSRLEFSHRAWVREEDLPPEIRELVNRFAANSFDERLAAYKRMRETSLLQAHKLRRTVFVSSWHRSPHESVAMWKIYGAPGPGIAIKSSLGRFRNAFKGKENLYVCRMQYIDFATAEMARHNYLLPAQYKRQAFAYEDEVRLFYWSEPDLFKEQFPGMVGAVEVQVVVPDLIGVAVDCDLDEMIEEIYISPYAPGWYRDTLQSVCDQFGVKKTIRPSALLEPPSA